MAFAVTNKGFWGALAATSASPAFTQASAPFSCLVVTACSYHATADPALPTITNSGTVLTWVQIADHIYSTGVNPRLRITAWAANLTTQSLSSQTITTASSGAAVVAGQLTLITDCIDLTASGAITNLVYADNAAGDPSFTLATMAADSGAFYCVHGKGGVSFTTATGYTSSAGGVSATGYYVATAYDLTSPATSIAVTSTNTQTSGLAFEIKVPQLIPISVSGQTRLGDATANAGLAAAFDGVTNAGNVAGAAVKQIDSTGNLYCGTRLASAKNISRITTYASNDQGYVAVTNPSVTLTAYGKNSSDPANSTDGTQIGTVTFTDTADGSAGLSFLCNNTTAYDRVWVRLNHATATARNSGFTEIILEELAGAGGSATGDLAVSETGSDIALISDDAFISATGQSRIGDMIGGGGLEAAFNSFTSEGATSTATQSIDNTGSTYCGTRLATATRIGKVIVYGPNNSGFVSLANPSVTLQAYGKSGSNPSNSSDGTLLGSVTFTDINDESGGRIISVTDVNTYDRIWVRLTHTDATSRGVGIAEIQFFQGEAQATFAATESGSDTADFTGWLGIAKTGPTLEFNNNNANSGTVSTTITVPSDTELIVVGWTGYHSVLNYYSSGSMTFTKGGVDTAMTPVSGGDAINMFMGAMFYMVNPDTGANKTLKWDWSGSANAAEQDSVCSITFWKGIASSSPIRSSGGAQSNTIPITSPTLTAQSGDRIIAYASFYLGTNTSEGSANTWSNLSTVTNVVHRQWDDGAWATGSPSGNTTVALSSGTNLSGSSALLAIVVIPFGAVADISGSINATESGADTASSTGNVTVTGTIPSTEVGSDTASNLASINLASQTRFGDLTSSGGLTSAFDGTTNSSATNTATKAITSSENAYVGTRLATAKIIGQAVIYGNNQYGFLSGDPTQPNVTISIYGKSGSDPANSTDGALLGSTTFVDTTSEVTGRTISCSSGLITYDRVWARLSHDGGSIICSVGELQLFEEVVAFGGTVAVTGNFSVTETGADTAALTGAVKVAGNFVVTETGADTLAITGAVPVAGNFVVSETGADTAALTSTVLVTGNFVVTEAGADTLAISGTLGPVPLFGDLAVAEAGTDTPAITGAVPVAGNFAVSETGADTTALTGTVPVSATFVTTETGSDTAALSGTLGPVPLYSDLAVTETGVDTLASTGTVPVTLNFPGQEAGSDTSVITGVIPVVGDFATTDNGPDIAFISASPGALADVTVNLAAEESGTDTYASTGTVRVAGSIAATEAGFDTPAFTANAITTANLSATEAGADTAASTGNVTVTGNFLPTETTFDSAALTGEVVISSSFAASETGADTALIIGSKDIQGHIDGQELNPDPASITGTVTVTGTIPATEIGSDQSSLIAGVRVASNFTSAEVGSDASSLIGTVAIAGNLSTTGTGIDTASINGTLGPVPLFGDLAVAEAGADTTVLLGRVTVTGDLVPTEVGASTAALSGTVTVTANFPGQETGADTAAMAGALGQTMVFADFNPIETGSDPPAISGTVTITGDFPAQEVGLDTASIVGALPAGTALMDAQEVGSDTAALSGVVPAFASFATQEIGVDTTSLVGTVRTSGQFAATETGVDTAASTGTAAVAGTFATQEIGSDTAALVGGNVTTANLDTSEVGFDVVSIGTRATVTGSISATDEADTSFLDIDVSVNGSVAGLEVGSDQAAFIAVNIVTTNLAWIEVGSDTTSIHPDVVVSANLAVSEIGTDTASLSGRSTVTGNLATTEIGQDTAVFSGGLAPAVNATFVAAETGVDTASGNGLTTITGSVVAAESFDDAGVFTGTVALHGSIASLEVGSDTAAFTATLPAAQVSIVAQEAGADTAAFTGFLPNVIGSINGLEVGSDTASISIVHQQIIQVNIAAQEAGADTANITGTRGLTMVFGSINTTEVGQDTASIPGVEIYIGGDLSAVEVGSDTAEQIAHVKVTGIFSLKEAGGDVANFYGGIPIAADLAAPEIGSDILFIDMIQQPAILVSIDANEIGSDIGHFRGTKVSAKPDADLMATFTVELMLQGSVTKVHDLYGAL